MPRYVCLLSIAAIAQFGLGIAGLTAADPSPAAPITFNKDIASIVYQKCAVCHHPGEVAPFPLLSYSDVKKRARQIETVIRDRFMPPWKSVEGHGRFIGERRLTKGQIDLIARWVEQGAVEGDSRELPQQPSFREGWTLGQPDIVLAMPEPFSVPADGPDVFRNFVFALAIPEGKYIKALEYRPGNRLVVHHAALMMDTKGKAREKDEADPEPGFGGAVLPGQLLSGSFAAWTPGRDPIPLPNGLSLPWKPRTDLILQLHLHPSGKTETEQSTIGFYLTDQPPQRSMVDMALINTKIDIPPGEKSYRSRDEFTLPVTMEALGIFPHMHLIGREFKVTAYPPGKEPISLLWINDWDFNWQGFYQYETAVVLPAGTQIVMETVHDNSAENFRNPNTPPKRMKWGDQTTDEMSVAILHLMPAREEDRGTLVATHRGRILSDIVATAPTSKTCE